VSPPEALRRLFPHTPPEALSVEGSEAAILERVLEDGDRADLRWLTSTVAEDRLVHWVRERGARQLSSRSRAFWCVVLDLSPPTEPAPGEELWPL